VIHADSAFASPQQLRELTTQLRRQPRFLVETLLGALGRDRESRAMDRLNQAIWGPAPSTRELRRAAADNLSAGIARRRLVLKASLTRAEAAERLGKTPQAVSAMLERGAILGLKEGREWRIPDWQLEPGLAEGVLPGLATLARAYRDGIVPLSAWVQQPHADLDGATPRAALARGDVDTTLAAARTE
jgi:hypothetical protein